jgi:membrane protein implicated in regulation of membrane protease activity
MFLFIWVSPTLLALVLSLAIGAGFGYWAGVIGAADVEPEHRSAVIGGGVIVGVLVLGVFTPLVWWVVRWFERRKRERQERMRRAFWQEPKGVEHGSSTS